MSTTSTYSTASASRRPEIAAQSSAPLRGSGPRAPAAHPESALQAMASGFLDDLLSPVSVTADGSYSDAPDEHGGCSARHRRAPLARARPPVAHPLILFPPLLFPPHSHHVPAAVRRRAEAAREAHRGPPRAGDRCALAAVRNAADPCLRKSHACLLACADDDGVGSFGTGQGAAEVDYWLGEQHGRAAAAEISAGGP